MKRTSTLRGRSEPRRWISPFCRVRSSLACSGRGSSPTSSRKRVPPSRPPPARRDRAGGTRERAAHMAEELALGQGLRQGGAVHLHQRPPCRDDRRCSRRAKQFLAHAGLAQQQHRQVAGGDHAAFVQQAAHGLAVRPRSPVVGVVQQAVVLLAARRCARPGAVHRSPLQPRHPHGRLDQPAALGAGRSRAASSNRPGVRPSSVRAPQGRPSSSRRTPMQSCTGSGCPGGRRSGRRTGRAGGCRGRRPRPRAWPGWRPAAAARR
jgi:hypothetical protein